VLAVLDPRGRPAEQLLQLGLALLERPRAPVLAVKFEQVEGAIICTGVQDRERVAELAERICAAIKEPYDFGGMQAVVDVSIGISCAPDDARGSDELMKQADVALYRAKADGRGIYRFFEREMVLASKRTASWKLICGAAS
jgi:diguanylate cyclase (GGDEF)-like protein